MLSNNEIYKMDCIEGMKQLDDNSVDIIIADPPYNLSKGNNWSWNNEEALKGFGGKWNKVMQNWDDMPLSDYFTFTLSWLAEAKRVLKPTGSMWVFGTYHNIGIINFAMQILEIEMINEVIWFKRNSFPNLSGRRLTASHETIIWAHSGTTKKREYYFNYEMSKLHDFEGDLIKQPLKQMRTVWDIPNNKKKEELAYGKHPTQKVEKVIDRMIRLSAKEGDLLLSPFCGAGTECVVAKKLGLNYIAFEIEEEYVNLSKIRLDNTQAGNTKLIEAKEVIDIVKEKKKSKKKFEKEEIMNESSYAEKEYILTGKETITPIQVSLDLGLEELDIKKVKREKAKKVILESSNDLVEQELLIGAKKKNLTETIPSILKWTGSKRKQAKFIVKELPANAERYIEPFFGGGAVAYLASNKIENVWANDLYTPLIEFWNMVKNDPHELINVYSKEWHLLQDNFPDYFYMVRERFNLNPNGIDLAFLTRTCVNGIVRFNKEGEFNNSIHLSRRGMKPSNFESIVNKWNLKLQDFKFTNLDYREVLEATKSGDVVYLDPPYAGSNNRYIADLDVSTFFDELEKLNSKGVKWLLSFDGKRGDTNLEYPVPEDLYISKQFLSNGASTLNQVLNGTSQEVLETLYKNF